MAKGAPGEVAERAGFKGWPPPEADSRCSSLSLPVVSSPGENAAKKHKSHVEDGARRQF